MAPSPIPAPLPPWAKALLQIAPFIPTGLQQVLEYIGAIEGSDSTSPDAWMHIQAVGQPVGSTERADDFVTTFDIVNITSGNVDSSWTLDDTDYVNATLTFLLTAWCSRMSADYKWRELRFYRRYFNPLTVDAPYAPSGPPQVVYPLNLTGIPGTIRRRRWP